MKLTPTKFYAAFRDGLLEMSGYSFQAVDRTFVVHRQREPYCEWDKIYLVSDFETGFSVPIPETRNRLTAAHYALDILRARPPEQLHQCFTLAARRRATLKIINKAQA